MRTTKKLPWPRAADDGTPLGIDLHQSENINLVRRILHHRLRTPHGFTFSDWLQEMLLILWRRNHQPSAYDPRKSSIETYITIVAKSVSLKLEKRFFTTQPQIIYVDNFDDVADEVWPEFGFDNNDNLNIAIDKYIAGTL